MNTNITVSQNVKDLGIEVCFVVFRNLQIRKQNDNLEALKSRTLKEITSVWKDKKIEEDDVLQGYWALHQKVHPKPEKVIASPEYLVRYILQKGTLPQINTVVDTYNLVSAKTLLALGAHDADKVEGSFRLVLTSGNERFLPLGRQETEKVIPDVYAYVDDNDVLCYLEYKQVEKTKVTDQTKNIIMIVQGNEATPYDYVLDGAKEIKTLIEKFCGGKGTIIEV